MDVCVAVSIDGVYVQQGFRC